MLFPVAVEFGQVSGSGQPLPAGRRFGMLKGMAKPLTKIVSLITPKRRWAQFSLGTMFVVMTGLCVWLAVQVNRANRQREAVAYVVSLGGKVGYDYQYRTGEYSPAALPPVPAWLMNLCGVDWFASVALVQVPSKAANDDVLNHLTAFQSLRSLDIRGRGVTDSGLGLLARCEGLEKLWLANTDISDAGMAILSKLPRLRYLVLRRTKISDSSIEQLATMQSLEDLDLSGTRITPVGAKGLSKKLPNCRLTIREWCGHGN